MKQLFETFKMDITPLTPVHIGSGEEVNPGDYFILDDDEGRPIMRVVDIGYLGSRLLKGREVMSKWIEEDPIAWVKKVEQDPNLVNMVKKYARFESYCTRKVAGEIQARWGSRDSRLGIQIMPGAVQGHHHTGRASIKGALRTALLWSAVSKPLDVRFVGTGDGQVAEWERSELGSVSRDIQDDLLRHLKIADATAAGVETIVVDTEHVGMQTQGGEQASLQDYRECLPDTLGDHRAYCISTSLSIATGHPNYRKSRGTLSRDIILAACREFYSTVMSAERGYWIGDAEITAIYDEIEHRLGQEPDFAPIRLGWGSGMNSVSLNLAKPPGRHPPRALNPELRKDPVTRRLLDGTYPPGWAMFKVEEC